jgi:dTDP-4-dehydrorhamnose 3,5-epimerase
MSVNSPKTIHSKDEPSLLESLLKEAVRDKATVTPEGVSLRRLTSGVTIRKLPTHIDQRGSVTELFDPRWGFHPDPLVFAYTFTIRPNVVKGWNLHRKHEDRYAILQGEMELVLFDPRPESPTYREVCRIVLSEKDRCIVNVPIDVWHADYNIGNKDVVVINFPTIQYDYNSPDKYRLPIDTPLIPYQFPAGAVGG